jgi:lysophospholipase L1-like esterase
VIGGEALNSKGYRGPVYPRERKAALRIAALGESATFGMGVPESFAWPSLLEQRLRARGLAVEVLNFGTVGYTIVQGRALYLGKVRDFRPDVVVSCFAGLNEQFAKTAGWTDLEKIERLQGLGLRCRVFLDRFASARWLAAVGGGTLTADAMEAPNRPADTCRVPLPTFASVVRQLRDDVARDGAKLVLVRPACSAPAEKKYPELIRYQQRVQQLAGELGLPLAAAHRAIREAERGEPPGAIPAGKPSRFFAALFHPSAEGAALFAAEIERALIDAGIVER